MSSHEESKAEKGAMQSKVPDGRSMPPQDRHVPGGRAGLRMARVEQ